MTLVMKQTSRIELHFQISNKIPDKKVNKIPDSNKIPDKSVIKYPTKT